MPKTYVDVMREANERRRDEERRRREEDTTHESDASEDELVDVLDSE